MATTTPGGEEIATITPSPDRVIDPRTGEPRRPLVVWIATALFYAGVATVTAGLLYAFWLSVDRFAEAAWLNRVRPTEPGSGWRAVLVAGLFGITVVIGHASIVAGYYAWRGFAWTRWAGLLALAVAFLALMVNPLAMAGIPLVAAGAGLLWLPASRRFFDHWTAVRHPQPSYPDLVDEVHYGPLERYR